MNFVARSEANRFYGWFVVAAAFVITLVGFGSAYTFSSFVGPLQREFGASRGSVSLVFSLAGCLYFALGVVSGPIADRWGVRKLAAIGMGLVGLGLILAARSHTLRQVYVAYTLGIGIGVGCAYVPTLGAVQRWFVKRRGLASGLAVSGIGVGTLVMPPLASWLIANFAWRGAYLALGIVAIGLGVGAALLMENDPGSRGQHPDGRQAGAQAPETLREGLSVREALRTARFRGLYLGCLVGSVGVFVPFVHLVPYATDRGIRVGTAVWLLGAIGIGSTFGRFLLGNVADRIGRGRFLVSMYVGMAASLAIWAFGGTPVPLFAFALTFGLFYGGWVAILPAVAADCFGAKHLGAIIGALYTSVAIGTLIGPSSAGFIYDFTHRYAWAIAISAVSSGVAAVVTAMALKVSR